ncbi:MAG: HAD family hydrolase [candidate division WOR-3 bacterium]
MKFNAVLFDLDGTLLDTIKDIAESMNAVLTKLKFRTFPVNDYRYFVGEGMEILCRRVIPRDSHSKEIIGKCVEMMKSEYQKNWLNNTKPYPGIPELLFELSKRNIKMAVLSNKPDAFTKIFVQKLLPDIRFSIVLGETKDLPKKPAPDGALQIAQILQIPPEDFLYLGDSNIDMKTAVSAGMYPVGALWGFRTADELLSAGAKRLIKKPEELLKII